MVFWLNRRPPFSTWLGAYEGAFHCQCTGTPPKKDRRAMLVAQNLWNHWPIGPGPKAKAVAGQRAEATARVKQCMDAQRWAPTVSFSHYFMLSLFHILTACKDK